MSRKSGSGSGYRQRKLVVENLERRSMLAGNVFVEVSAGSLIIRGDNNDNAILVTDLGGGTYAVSGGDFGDIPELADQGFQTGPTVIKGGEETDDPNTRIFPGVTNDINIDMKKGDDVVALGNSVEDLNALALECFGFGFSSGSGDGGGDGTGSGSVSDAAIEDLPEVDGTFSVPRNLYIYTGDGNDYVVANANVGTSSGGVAVINTGNGHDGVAFGSPNSFAPMEESAQVESEFGVHVEINLVILTGSGDDHVCVTNAQIDNLLSIQTGDGHDGVEVHDVIAGVADVITGNGNDDVLMSNFALDYSLSVVTGAGHDQVVVEGFSAGAGDGPSDQNNEAGVVVINTGAGDDQLIVEGFDIDALVIDTGTGNDGSEFDREFPDFSAQQIDFDLRLPILVYDGFVTRGITVVTGAGNDFAQVEFVTASDITINTGTGNDGSFFTPIAVYAIDVKNNLVVVTGEGHDYAYLYSGFEVFSEVGGSVIVNMGGGNDLLGIVDFDIANDLIVTLGAGNDAAGIGTTEGFADGSSQGTLRVGRNLILDAGSGHDEVAAANLQIHNDIFAYLGAGKDNLDFYNSTVGGNAFLDAGADQDSVYIEDVEIGGKASVFMGAGNDTLSIYNSSAQSLYLRGRAGKDTFNNDLGIDSNGKDGNIDVAEFEVFNDAV